MLGQQLRDLGLHHGLALGRRQIRLGHGDDPGRDRQQVAHGQVLAGLRLDPLVGGDDEQHHADAAEPGEGVVQEPLVTWHVHEADLKVLDQQMGEADVDRDAAPLLFLPAIAVDAGQGLDEPGLAVVDVAGGADDDAPHEGSPRRARRARCG